MTDLIMLGNSFCSPCIDVPKIYVPLFDPKVHHFENSLLKMLAQLQCKVNNKTLGF